MDENIRQGLEKLTHCYTRQIIQYKQLEALALEQAKALVAPQLDMQRIHEILEKRLDILEDMESLIKETRETQRSFCNITKMDQLILSKLKSQYGNIPEFQALSAQIKEHQTVLETMIHLDEANQRVMKERMNEMKAAGHSLDWKSRARKAYRDGT